MDSEKDASTNPAPAAPLTGTIRNLGEPVRFTNVELCGLAAEPGRGGQNIKVWTRLALTSDDPLFYRLVEGFASIVNHLAQQAAQPVSLDSAKRALMVIKADNTAELWVDKAAVAMRCMVKRKMNAGTALFERDIADVTAMTFPCVNIDATDRVLCVFREGWRFGFAFDFNPDRNLDVEAFTCTLGTLYRELRYSSLYEAIRNQVLLDRLVTSGWFPFVEIITTEFRDLVRHCEAGFDLADIESALVTKFDPTRLDSLLERWLAKPHYAAKEQLLRAAIDAYNRKDPVAVIKILLTEIEGVLNDAYRATHGGRGAKLKTLLKFAVESAKRKAGQPNTLLLPAEFARYLAAYTFANFDPVAQTGTAGSRHAVGHGAAAQASYTMPRALQAILTLDQLAFYT